MSREESQAVCPSCANPVREKARYCDHCGQSLSVAQVCAHCGADNPAGRQVCKNCGLLGAEEAEEAVEAVEAEPVPPNPSFDYLGPLPVSEGNTQATGTVEWLRKEILQKIWPPFQWSAKPILFVAIVLAAVWRANFKISDAEALFPGQGALANLTTGNVVGGDQPSANDLQEFTLPLDITALAEVEVKTAAFETLGEGFIRPHGVTTANGLLYVVDPGVGAMFVLDAVGNQVALVTDSSRPFVEPVDVGADLAGNIYVLDAGDGGQVSVHGPGGDFLRTVPIAEGTVERSRGLDVDSLGRIWVAITPALAVAAFDADGRELVRFSTALKGAELQPVDVAFFADDAIYVSAVGPASVLRFSATGEPLSLWPLTDANSLDGPHVSLDSSGILYVTQPEKGGFLRISGDSAEEMEAWQLPAAQSLRKLVGISVVQEGNLVVTDSENGQVYRIQVEP